MKTAKQEIEEKIKELEEKQVELDSMVEETAKKINDLKNKFYMMF